MTWWGGFQAKVGTFLLAQTSFHMDKPSKSVILLKVWEAGFNLHQEKV